MGILACNPISGVWDLQAKGDCINYDLLFLCNEVITITLDIVVLLLPIWHIFQLKLSQSQRVSTSGTFLFGLV